MTEDTGRARAWLVEREGYDPSVTGDKLDDEARVLTAYTARLTERVKELETEVEKLKRSPDFMDAGGAGDQIMRMQDAEWNFDMDSLSERLWAVACCGWQAGFAIWGMFSKSPRWYPRNDSWGGLESVIFWTREEADIAFAENGFDKEQYRVAPVKVTIAEVSEEEAKIGTPESKWTLSRAHAEARMQARIAEHDARESSKPKGRLM